MQQKLEPIILYLHIPKTAGTTLGTIIDNQYKKRGVINELQPYILKDVSYKARKPKTIPTLGSLEIESIRLIKGHFLWGYHENIYPKTYRYITFLRDPVARVVSEYYHIQQTPQHFLHQEVVSQGMSLAEYVESGIWLSDNLQVRFLSGQHHLIAFDQVKGETLKLAKRNLDYCDFVGITEKFDESILYLSKILNWKLFKLGYVKQKSNVVPVGNRQKITKKERDIIEKHNYLDQELYNYGIQRLEKIKEEIHKDKKIFLVPIEKLIMNSLKLQKKTHQAIKRI